MSGVAGVLTGAISLALFAQVAAASEWNSGHFNEPGGNVPAKENARSECLFNGLDEPDESAPGAGDGEELYYDEDQEAWVGDDGDWAQTPAGGKVQSGGQIKASSAQVTGDPGAFTGGAGVEGVACNGHTNPINN